MQRLSILIRKRKEEGGRDPNGHGRPQHDNAPLTSSEASAAAAVEAGSLAVEPERTELLGLEQLLYRDASASPLLDRDLKSRCKHDKHEKRGKACLPCLRKTDPR